VEEKKTGRLDKSDTICQLHHLLVGRASIGVQDLVERLDGAKARLSTDLSR